MAKLRVLALMHRDLVPPDSIEGLSDEAIAPFKTEYDVTATLHNLGHQVRSLGVAGELAEIRKTIEEWKPHVVFNLLEEFDGEAVFDQHVVSYLELLHQPYTGCGPRGLMLARDKALSKQILSYHRIHTPPFTVVPRGTAVRRPRKLEFPLIVKTVNEEASLGISQASVVDNDDKLAERVRFIHERFDTDALVEAYIHGRELYVGILGNQRLRTFPIWELLFEKMPEDVPRIATAKVKFDYAYQRKMGISSRQAQDLPEGGADRIHQICKRIYRYLGLRGYARIDLRLTDDGQLYFLEANPNPQLAFGEDFAEAAAAAGLSYDRLIQRLLTLGMRRN